MTQNGPLKLLEAVDDKGQSLLIALGGVIAHRESGYFGMAAGSSLQLQAPLRHPAEPGRSIRKIRGVLPVQVATRKPDPLVIPLSGAEGKSFQNGEVTIGVQEIRANPQNRQTSLDLTIRAAGAPSAPFVAGAGAGGVPNGEFTTPRPDLHQQQIEIIDAQGRPIPWYQSSFDGEGSRLTLTLTPNDQGTPGPSRYYGLSCALTEVSFEFFDVPMP